MTFRVALFAALFPALSPALVALAGLGCTPSRPSIHLDQLPIARTIRNSATVKYQSVWSGVSFVAQSNQVVIDVVDPGGLETSRDRLRDGSPDDASRVRASPVPSVEPRTGDRGVTRRASTTPIIGAQSVATPASMPLPVSGAASTPAPEPAPAPLPTAENAPAPNPTDAIGRNAYEPKRGAGASEAHASAATNRIAAGGATSTESQAAGASSGAGIGGTDTASTRGAISGEAVTGATTRQFERAAAASSSGIGGIAAAAERGEQAISGARGGATIQRAGGNVEDSRAIGGVAVSAVRPELSIEKRVDRSRVLHGFVITFTLTIRNVGRLPVEATEVLDELAPDLALMDTKGARPTVDHRDPQLLHFRLREPFAPRAEQIITITAQVREPRRP